MLMNIDQGVPYLVAYPMGCLAYNKWGRPNPPYVVFKREQGAWQTVPLAELPTSITTPNLIFSSPDETALKMGQPVVSAERIRSLIAGYRQSEFRTVLREKIPEGRLLAECELRVQYKGRWILPNDPIARSFIDSQSKE